MAFYLKWLFWGSLATILAGFLYYTLPQTDVVRVVETEVRRVDLGGENTLFWSQPDAGQAVNDTRDVFFIQTELPNGRPMVYRNEDTGWGWPPYFKFDTANLQTQASALRTRDIDDQRWAAIRHYGVRIPYLSIYPNAVTIRAVDGPDVRIIPWIAIICWILVISFIWFVTARWLRFKRRYISPRVDRADAWYDDKTGRFSRWVDTWRSKPRS
ncbi:DUF1523 family protein [Aestuariibius sp. 2305UL40-4]|uniref:DUF1523 family protein n=1 Tax=Aestuariibius violaceus TaxID=3234132 RepID=UPI00345E52B3